MGRVPADSEADSSESLIPRSPLFEIRKTAYSGRGVFASQAIPSGQQILTTSPTPVHVLYRLFRREACGWCFAYDGGRTFKISSSWNGAAVQYFCSDACRERWEVDLGELGCESWAIVEGWLRKAKSSEDEEPDDSDPPTAETVDAAWEEAERDGSHIFMARRTTQQTKTDRRCLSRALSAPAHPGVLAFLLSGILASHNRSPAFSLLRQLEGVSTPYRSPAHLQSHITSYLTLLALLPLSLLSSVISGTLRTLASVDAHNSFGIWSDAPGRGEMLGYGIWPDASFFNHSCRPIIAERVRAGRIWSFVSGRDVAQDEEVTISYLSAEELREMDVKQRRECLRRSWGFECMCLRCVEDDSGSGV